MRARRARPLVQEPALQAREPRHGVRVERVEKLLVERARLGAGVDVVVVLDGAHGLAQDLLEARDDAAGAVLWGDSCVSWWWCCCFCCGGTRGRMGEGRNYVRTLPLLQWISSG